MIQTKAKTYSYILIGRGSIKYFDYLYTAMFSIKTQLSIPEFDLYFCQVKLYLYFDLKKKWKGGLKYQNLLCNMFSCEVATFDSHLVLLWFWICSVVTVL